MTIARQGPLAGLHVVDLSERSVPAALIGMVLADYGATVFRVEPPGGDQLRTLGVSDVWLRGQHSVSDGADGPGHESIRALCDGADVVIDTDRAWSEKTFAYTPSLPGHQVYCLITDEPVAAADVAAGVRPGVPVYGEVAEARFGFMFIQDGHREKPVYLAWPHAHFGTAWLALSGIMAALSLRLATGRGQAVTTSLFDGLAALNTQRWIGGGNPPLDPWPPYSSLNRMGNSTMIIALCECADGRFVQMNSGARGAANNLFRTLGREDLVDPAYDADPGKPFRTMAECNSFWEHLPVVMKTKPAREWVELLAPLDVSIAVVLEPGEMLHHPQAEAQGLVHHGPRGESFGLSGRFERSPAALNDAVPAPGEHDADLLAQALSAPPWSGLGEPRPPAPGGRKGPLAGVTVLDLGLQIAGPFASRVMADMGARVIKVNERNAMVGRTVIGSSLGINRGKEAISLDLKSARGKAVLRKLVERSDVLHHNMRAGVAERLGITASSLAEVNPRIIYCHSSGYGDLGPWAELPAWGPLLDAVSGMLARSGGTGNAPMHYATHVDYGGALNAAPLILAALLHRQRTDEGQGMEVPQLAAAMFAMSDARFVDGKLEQCFAVDSLQFGHAATNRLVRTADGWLVLACYSEREWQAAHGAFGLEVHRPYAEARRILPGSEREDRGLLEAIGQARTDDALGALRSAGVACAAPDPVPVELPEVLLGGDLERLKVMVRYEHPAAGSVFEVGHMVRFSDSEDFHTVAAPPLGGSTTAVLEELGFSADEIAELYAEGAAAQIGWKLPGEGDLDPGRAG